MLIEFSCPTCCAPLAVKEEVAGGQVNCPKCESLILIPESSPFLRQGEAGPFDPGITHTAEEATRAIQICVSPYRRRLEAKDKLLKDAVEMVKTRNKRIKEIESLILDTQKDLWALEVEYDERREDYLRTHEELKSLRERITHLEKGASDNKEAKALHKALEKSEKHTAVLESRLNRSLLSLAKANQRTTELLDQTKPLGETGKLLEKLDHDFSTWKTTFEQEERPTLSQGAKLLATARGQLTSAQKRLQSLQAERNALREEVQRLTADMQALRDAQETDRKARENADSANGRELMEAREERDQLTTDLRTLQEQAGLWEEEAKELREKNAAMEKKAETREAEANALKTQMTRDANKAEKQISTLTTRLERLQGEYAEQDEYLQSVLKNQQHLTDQSVKLEEQRRELKLKLTNALERLEDLES